MNTSASARRRIMTSMPFSVFKFNETHLRLKPPQSNAASSASVLNFMPHDTPCVLWSSPISRSTLYTVAPSSPNRRAHPGAAANTVRSTTFSPFNPPIASSCLHLRLAFASALRSSPACPFAGCGTKFGPADRSRVFQNQQQTPPGNCFSFSPRSLTSSSQVFDRSNLQHPNRREMRTSRT